MAKTPARAAVTPLPPDPDMAGGTVVDGAVPVARTPGAADGPVILPAGTQMPDARSVADQAIADALVRQERGGLHPSLSDEAVRRGEAPLRHPDAIPLGADPETIGRLLSPGRADPVPTPLPPLQPHGTTGVATPDRLTVAPAFDRRYTIDTLVQHPSLAVRQRAQEARAAIHHGSADSGILIRAAIDSAMAAERTR